MKNKILCALTAAVCAFAVNCMPFDFQKAYAEENSEEDIWDNYEYMLFCDGYSLSFGLIDTNSDSVMDERILAQCLTSSELSEVTVEIPSEFGGLPVTEIKSGAFSYCKNLTAVTIPETVERLNKGVLNDCPSLKKVTFNNYKCVISNNAEAIGSEVVIYGYENSTAQAYAEKYEREFVSIGKASEEITNLSGDANDDGYVNVRDCAFIANALAKDLADTLPQTADFNDDGKINVRDAAAIAKFLATAKK